MDTTKIDVNNKEEIKVFVINNVELRIINLSLGRYVDVSVVLKQGNEFVSAQNFRIEGQEYDDWGNDDEYLENLVLQKLGLTRKE
jgi:hypothetical protein